MQNGSSITHSKGGVMFAGPQAVDVFRAISLKSAIKMAMSGLKATRGFTLTKGLAMASEYTGKRYKRTEAATAVADLEAIIAERRAALPETTIN